MRTLWKSPPNKSECGTWSSSLWWMELSIMFNAVGGDAHHASLHHLEEKVRHWQNQATKSARCNLIQHIKITFALSFSFSQPYAVRVAYEVSNLKPDLWFIVIYNNTKTSHKRQINTQMLFQHLLWEKEFWASAKEWEASISTETQMGGKLWNNILAWNMHYIFGVFSL